MKQVRTSRISRTIRTAAAAVLLSLMAAACGASSSASAAETTAAAETSKATETRAITETTAASETGISEGTEGKAADAAGEVTVTATGTVRLVPDRAELSLGITNSDQKPETAQKKNTEQVNRVIEALKKQGVEEKSIRTDGYNLYPRYEYRDGQDKLAGYEVSTILNVGDLTLEQAGTVLSAAVDAGVTNVNSVRYLCSGYDEAYEEALQKAVAAAERKAGVLASAAGQKLSKAVAVTEGYQDMSARYSRSMNGMAKEEAAVAMGADSVGLMPGETEIRAVVTVTYQMR